MRPFDKIFLLFFLLLSGFVSRAQSYDSLWKLRAMERSLRFQLKHEERVLARKLKETDKDKLHLSLSPLGALFDFVDRNITLGAEYCLTPQVSVRTDMGYIFHSAYFFAIPAKVTRGFIVRPMIRFYSMRNVRSSFDLAFHYKYVASTMEDWLGRLPVNGVASYQEFTEFDIVRSRWGIMFFYNYKTPLLANERCHVEFYCGLGIKSRLNTYIKEQSNSAHIYRNLDTDPQYLHIPNVQLGLRLVYKFPHDLFQKTKLKEGEYKTRNEGVK